VKKPAKGCSHAEHRYMPLLRVAAHHGKLWL